MGCTRKAIDDLHIYGPVPGLKDFTLLDMAAQNDEILASVRCLACGLSRVQFP
jgi:hypothetical protein